MGRTSRKASIPRGNCPNTGSRPSLDYSAEGQTGDKAPSNAARDQIMSAISSPLKATTRFRFCRLQGQRPLRQRRCSKRSAATVRPRSNRSRPWLGSSVEGTGCLRMCKARQRAERLVPVMIDAEETLACKRAIDALAESMMRRHNHWLLVASSPPPNSTATTAWPTSSRPGRSGPSPKAGS